LFRLRVLGSLDPQPRGEKEAEGFARDRTGFERKSGLTDSRELTVMKSRLERTGRVRVKAERQSMQSPSEGVRWKKNIIHRGWSEAER
jgi:hypothetical protein